MNYRAVEQALYQQLGMTGPLPHTFSYAMPGEGRRRTIERPDFTEEYYPASAQTDGSLRENLRFAFKNEPLDLRVIVAALDALGAQGVKDWVQTEPTGKFSRLAWFYYEAFVDGIPELPAVTNAPYVNALDTKHHYVAKSTYSPRHHINDNLLGGNNLCPTLRRTQRLETFYSVTCAIAPTKLQRVVLRLLY